LRKGCGQDSDDNRRETLVANQTIQMTVRENVALPVRDEADIHTAVALGRMMATRIGFAYTDQIRLETIIVELTSHALRQGSEGTVTLRCVERNGLPGGEVQLGLEVVVGDYNSNAVDLAKMLAGKEGVYGEKGASVSSVRQLADEFVINSMVGRGTRMCVRKWGRAHSAITPRSGNETRG
jgi:serine/threonine-protein kinase RsbT